MSAQEVPTDSEQVDTGGGVPDAPHPTPTTTTTTTSAPLTAPVTIKKEPSTLGASNGKDVPAEICVVVGGGRSRNDQTQGSYVCGICGKKYKYYNCFQTHVRAHRESDSMPGEGAPPTPNNSFRYSCDICGKKYKYYSCFQEHRDLHAVDDPYEQVVLGPVEDLKEEEQVEPFQKIGPKTGSYVCEFCGKQYKYFNPYQEHVALHQPMNCSFDNMKLPRSRGSGGNLDVSKYGAIKLEKDIPFNRKMESKMQSSLVDTNSSQNSSGTPSPLVTGSFPASQKPYTCGTCGIQFQFYNNLLEHMQSHAADNENHSKGESPKTSPGPVSQEQLWSSPQPPHQPQHQPQTQIVQVQIQAQPQPAQRNHYTNQNSGLPEKERQQVAERLLRVMCADLGALNMLNSKDFLKLAQTLVDTGARHGAYSTRDALGNMSSLALRQLPRMYNQVKVKVTCALGSNSSLGIAVTCHSQTVGPDACLVLTAYQVEGSKLKRYILGVKEADLREGPEQVHQWTQNVLSEFVMSDIRTVYVTEPGVSAVGMGGSPLGGGGRARMCLRCAGCSLGAVVQAVLGKRSLQARGLHELAELLTACRDIAASTSLSLRDESAGSADEGTSNPSGPPGPSPTPPCWDRTAEALLQVHAHFEQICEAYGRSKATAPTLQGLNKHMLGTLAYLLAPLRLAALELSSQRRPTLQQVLPVYLRLEKLFTSKAGEAGTASKLCHYFLEALKENFKVEKAHQVAMVLDPQLKLRPVPAYQHEEIIARACEMATDTRDGGYAAGGGSVGEEVDGPSAAKRPRGDASGGGVNARVVAAVASSEAPSDESQTQVRQEVFQYLAEPLLQGNTPDLIHYWSTTVGDRYPRLARLALWLLAVPAVGVRSECVSVCEQSLAMKRRQQVTAEEMNKLIFLRSNMA
ncbi:zinc finger protein 618 isoform X2 [Esox lucius]|uniref:C2H2-type domain-containing protein n=1 Tax=Esox lucius TaxID=8010 RepID=A0A3P8YE55_ESOLU|nr:zinc finger protein 618 isoform X2 [Esox lucius]